MAKREFLALTLMCLFESNWKRLVSANKVRTKAIYWTMKLILSIVWDYKTTPGKGDRIILHVYSVPQRWLIIEWAGAPWPVKYITPSPAPPKVCGPVQSCKSQPHIRKTWRRFVFTVAWSGFICHITQGEVIHHIHPDHTLCGPKDQNLIPRKSIWTQPDQWAHRVKLTNTTISHSHSRGGWWETWPLPCIHNCFSAGISDGWSPSSALSTILSFIHYFNFSGSFPQP